MEESIQTNETNKEVAELKTFPVPFTLIEIKENITIYTHTPSKPSKEELINQANRFHSQGNISEAAKYYQHFINQGFKDYRVFVNYGSVLQSLGKLQEAERLTRKAIDLKPDFAEAYSNLGGLLKDQGKLKEAELYIRKSIKFNPKFFNSHFLLSNVLIKQKKLQEAEKCLRKTIQLNPNFAIAYLNLGSIMIDLGRLHDAESSTRKAIQLKADYKYAHLNLGNILRALGKFKEAELSTRKAIELNPNYVEAHSNLGGLLKDQGKLKEAELSLRKAIELNPNYAEAHSNLGGLLKDQGKLKEAELSLRKAIELNPNFAIAYFNLSSLKYSNQNIKWKDQLFSESILKNKLQKDQVNVYFARANILHKEKNYKESSRYLTLANKLKLDINPSKPEMIFNKSKILLVESNNKEMNQNKYSKCHSSIFIVGMFRSGSTLLESILSMNNNVDDLGEIKILEESFLKSKEINNKLTLAEEYWKRIKGLKKQANITTDKNLFNYQYAGIIANQIPNAKIIHCFRNPLDNILSIYRANFAKGNEYSSSLVDCAKIYLDQEVIMKEYKNRFRSEIYNLNYDLLVSNPKQEIQSLISWLGWEWNNDYLEPHLNQRAVSTASSIQVRSPINAKSIGGWKNYKNMLKPAIEILTKTDKYRNIAF